MPLWQALAEAAPRKEHRVGPGLPASSQRSNLDWKRMAVLVDTWLPKARILHPYPEQRFAERIRDKSRVR